MNRKEREQHLAVIAYAEITAAMVNGVLLGLVSSGAMSREQLNSMIDTIESGRKHVPDPLGRPYSQRIDPGLFEQFRTMIAIAGGAAPAPEPDRSGPVN